jgi:hypothetical protein
MQRASPAPQRATAAREAHGFGQEMEEKESIALRT